MEYIPPEIYIKDSESGNICTVLFSEQDTIADLQSKMQATKRNALKVDGRRLVFKKRILANLSLTMAEAGLQPGCILLNEPWLRIHGDTTALALPDELGTWMPFPPTDDDLQQQYEHRVTFLRNELQSMSIPELQQRCIADGVEKVKLM